MYMMNVTEHKQMCLTVVLQRFLINNDLWYQRDDQEGVELGLEFMSNAWCLVLGKTPWQ